MDEIEICGTYTNWSNRLECKTRTRYESELVYFTAHFHRRKLERTRSNLDKNTSHFEKVTKRRGCVVQTYIHTIHKKSFILHGAIFRRKTSTRKTRRAALRARALAENWKIFFGKIFQQTSLYLFSRRALISRLLKLFSFPLFVLSASRFRRGEALRSWDRQT